MQLITARSLQILAGGLAGLGGFGSEGAITSRAQYNSCQKMCAVLPASLFKLTADTANIMAFPVSQSTPTTAATGGVRAVI